MHHDSSHAARSLEPEPSLAPHCSGREAELARLLGLYRDASERGGDGAARLVFVEGPSGIGKSRLLVELQSRVRLQGGVVLSGRCDPGSAFGPFGEIVDHALRFLDEVGVAPELDLSGLACARGCHRLWHRHGGPEVEGADELLGMSREAAFIEKRMRFFDAIAALLREVARFRAPLLVFDDLERADRGTFDLVEFLLDEPLSAFLVGSVRSEEGAAPAPELDALREHERTARVEVGSLDREGVRAYLQSSRAIQRVLERTGGLPEAIDLLLEGAPLTAEERLRRHLEALPPGGRALVEALAVLGRAADLEELSAVAGVHATAAERAAVANAELLGRSIVDGRILFAFERAADAERCYGLLDDERRRALHARAADVCSLSIDGHEGVRHALAAGDHERASELAVVAAATLSARHGHAEAAALLESLLAAVPDAPPGIRESLAELHRVTGDYRRALEHARAVLAAAPDDLRAAHRVGQLLTMAGEHDEAAAILTSAEARAEEAADRRMLAEIEAQLAELHYQRADYPASASCARRSLREAALASDLTIEIQARNALGKVALAQHEPKAALALFEENGEKAAAAGLGHQEAQAHTNIGVAMLVLNDLEGAERACLRAIEVATRASDTRDRAIATENLAVLAHMRRDYRKALGHYHEAVALLKRLGNRAMLARVAHNLGELYDSLGDVERARSLASFARRVGGEDLPPQIAGEGLLLEGRVERADENIARARDAFERARATFAELDSPRGVEAALELARLALVDGEVAAARALLAELPLELGAKHEADRALVAAELERASGGDVRGAARRAVELAEGCDDPERLLVALIGLARALGDDGEVGAATRLLERARTIEDELTARVPDAWRAIWAERPARVELTKLAAELASAWTRTRHASMPPPRVLATTLASSVASPSGPDAEKHAGWARRYPGLIGRSEEMSRVFSVLDKVAAADALVLVRGESGTGKELVAEAIHRNSPRRGKPFVKVNCAALVETLLLSELFGHERGAFTGASARKKGRFELADGGTIFLDEIGDISPKTQVALLRVLQEREFERVGGTQPIKVDVRIIAATHRDLELMVQEGSFREDLYYRLRGVMVDMPPLRERLADLPALADHLLTRIAEERGEAKKTMSPDALDCLAGHRWPGNVRELENVLRSATLFAEGDVLHAGDFAAFAESFVPPDEPRAEEGSAEEPGAQAARSADPMELEELAFERIRGGEASLAEMKKIMERECIVRALAETRGNITRAAALLGMKRPRLSQLVKQYGLKAEE